MKNKNLNYITIATILTLLIITQFGSVIADNTQTIEVVNMSGTSYNYTYSQLSEMPKTIVTADLYCDGALATTGNWGGVLLSYLLNQTQRTNEVSSVQFVASDGYKVAIPIDLALQPNVIVAYEMDGQPLAEGLRLVLPSANGGSWIAKIIIITMSTSGADYPLGISVGGGKINDLQQSQDSTPKPSSPPQQLPVQPQPSTTPDSASFQQATPTNVPTPTQPTLTPQVSDQSLNLPTVVGLIVIACTISFTVTTYVAVRHKRKQNPLTT